MKIGMIDPVIVAAFVAILQKLRKIEEKLDGKIRIRYGKLGDCCGVAKSQRRLASIAHLHSSGDCVSRDFSDH